MAPSRSQKNPQNGKKIDIIIPVMGPTGAGKSTFINVAQGTIVAEVGHGTTSCTVHPRAIEIPIPGAAFPHLQNCRLLLLDTPGFDDTHQEDLEILKRIAKWLESSRRNGALVGGVLYFHDISAKRFTGTARQNLAMFSRLCGDAALKNTFLVTTNWGSGVRDVLERREDEMKTSHWRTIIEKGVGIRRFVRDNQSASGIIEDLLRHAAGDVSLDLQIQRELIDLGLTIPETEAGKELRCTLKQLLQMQRKAVALQESSGTNELDPDAIAGLEEAQKQTRMLQDQVEGLRVKLSLPKRFLKFLHLR